MISKLDFVYTVSLSAPILDNSNGDWTFVHIFQNCDAYSHGFVSSGLGVNVTCKECGKEIAKSNTTHLKSCPSKKK